jgi:phenylpropionate dioxygenase-like ring-hydroxylating dioxygenase large terminal subunit
MSISIDLGSSLERRYYVDPAIYEAELDKIWLPSWRYFAHAAELPNRGDFVTRELLGESVIVVRQDDDAVQAYLNVCRHRGAQLCRERAGNRRTLSCPYHAWTWHLDGTLIARSAMEAEEDFSAEEFPLWKVHTEVWRGLIFVCLGETAPAPIGAELDRTIPDADRIRFDRIKPIAVREYLHRANWKLGVENFSECYHCDPVHSLLPISMDVAMDYAQHGDHHGERYVRSGHYPKDGCVSFTRDGQYVCSKPFGVFGDGDPVPPSFGCGVVSQPDMFTILFQADYGVIQEFLPIGIDRTLFVTRWFVNADAGEGVEYEVDDVVDVWDVTNIEDQEIIDSVQKGISSRRFTPGPLQRVRESGNRNLFVAYHSAMGA